MRFLFWIREEEILFGAPGWEGCGGKAQPGDPHCVAGDRLFCVGEPGKTPAQRVPPRNPVAPECLRSNAGTGALKRTHTQIKNPTKIQNLGIGFC